MRPFRAALITFFCTAISSPLFSQAVWTKAPLNTHRDLKAIAYGPSGFVTGGDGVSARSASGLTWDSTLEKDVFYYDMVYGRNYVAAAKVKGVGKIRVSAEGSNWTNRNSGAPGYIPYAVTYADGTFLSGGSSGKTARSSDGLTWNPDFDLPHDLVGAGSHGTMLFLVGKNGETAGRYANNPQIGTILSLTSFTTLTLNDLAWGKNKWVIASQEGCLFAPAPPVPGHLDTFTNYPTGVHDNFNGICYAKGLFVAVGDRGTLLESPDGTTWVKKETGTQHNLKAVTYGAGRFVAVGEHGTIISRSIPDAILPSITLTSTRSTTSSPALSLAGTVSDNLNVASLRYRIRKESSDSFSTYKKISLSSTFTPNKTFTCPILLASKGTWVVEFLATDWNGNKTKLSKTVKRT